MLKIVEQAVSIKILSVGKLRFTKSLFNQLLIQNPFDINLNLVRGEVFGFVHTDGARHLIWVNEGELRKYPLTRLLVIYRINERTELYDIKSILQSFGFLPLNDKYPSARGMGAWGLTLEEQGRLQTMVGKAEEIMDFLADKQIFL